MLEDKHRSPPDKDIKKPGHYPGFEDDRAREFVYAAFSEGLSDN